MPHMNHTYRLLTSTVLLLAAAGPVRSSEDDKKPAPSLTGIAVSFKLDPRLATGVYGGERWVSPPTYVTTLNTVEARVQGIDAKGSSVRIGAEWIPADPEVVTVSPSQGEQVKITAKRAGQSILKIHSQDVVKELAIKATSRGEFMQVEISQVRGVRAVEDAGTKDVSALKSPDRAATEGVPPLIRPATGAAQGARTLPTQKEKLSYALGANLGNGIRREAIEVNPDLIIQGLKDTLSGSTPLLTQHEISVAVAGLKTELTSKRITSAAEKINATKQVAEQNKEAGEAFLAENRAKEGVVTLGSGLQYKVLKAGDGKKPTAGDIVVCHYRGTLIDGTEFDSSYQRNQPATFPLTKVIKGWNEALQLMPAGSKWQLFIPPDLAYGDRGASSGIGPNATLIFEVELISIEDGSGKSAQAAKIEDRKRSAGRGR